jgi:hypothetical protein
LAHALVLAAVFQIRGERPMAQQYADAAIAPADEHGLVFYGTTKKPAVGEDDVAFKVTGKRRLLR